VKGDDSAFRRISPTPTSRQYSPPPSRRTSGLHFRDNSRHRGQPSHSRNSEQGTGIRRQLPSGCPRCLEHLMLYSMTARNDATTYLADLFVDRSTTLLSYTVVRRAASIQPNRPCIRFFPSTLGISYVASVTTKHVQVKGVG